MNPTHKGRYYKIDLRFAHVYKTHYGIKKGLEDEEKIIPSDHIYVYIKLLELSPKQPDRFDSYKFLINYL